MHNEKNLCSTRRIVLHDFVMLLFPFRSQIKCHDERCPDGIQSLSGFSFLFVRLVSKRRDFKIDAVGLDSTPIEEIITNFFCFFFSYHSFIHSVRFWSAFCWNLRALQKTNDRYRIVDVVWLSLFSYTTFARMTVIH